MAGLRDGLSRIATATDAWAGIPMPLDGQRLVIEPSFANAAMLSSIGRKCADCGKGVGLEHKETCPRFEPGIAVGVADERSREGDGWSFVNEWYCSRWRCKILVMRSPEGRVEHAKVPAFHHIAYDTQTMACSDVWGLEQEHRALRLLGEMVRHRQMKQYVLTGMLMETSRRSGVTYLFRRLKPTVAIAPSDRSDDSKSMRILAALCMHPIAYYAGSWAGGMCPTDDVIAHLSLMRGDESMFWRRSNQHAPYRPEAGL